MCYSKEVSLAVAAAIAGHGSYAWWKFVLLKNYKKIKNKLKRKKLRAFFFYVIIAYSCIGLHQLFEFLAIYTNSPVVYKIGLLFSIF